MSMNRLTRRDLLHASAGSLLAAGLWPGALAAADRATEEFHFAVVNDTHYRDHKCNEWMARLFMQIKGHKEKVAFCLLVGDVSHNGKPMQLGAMRSHAKLLGQPVYPVIGNHDYIPPNEGSPYKKVFPGQINYHFEFGGWQFIGLDSTQGASPSGTTILPDTFTWLKGRLGKLDKNKPMVLFTHFPLGPGVKRRPRNANDLLDHFRPFNLRAVFNGHRHQLTEKRVNDVPITTNHCCSSWCPNHDGSLDKGYFLCHARNGQITRTVVGMK
jgi:calcineurin-like phosphoesterase family protein